MLISRDKILLYKNYVSTDYTDILNRIDSRKGYSQQDIDALSRQIIVSGNGNVVQIGGYNINNNSGYIHIGNILYQGISADALNKAIAQAIALHRSNINIPNSQVQDNGLVPFRFYFILIWMLTSLLVASGFTYFSVKNNALYMAHSVSIFQVILQFSFAFFVSQLFFWFLRFIYEMRFNEFQWRRVRHSYFHWAIYPVLTIIEIVFFILKIVIKISCNINNNNKRKDIFSPFKWF